MQRRVALGFSCNERSLSRSIYESRDVSWNGTCWDAQQQRMRGGGSSGGTSGSGWRDRTLLDSSLLGTSSGICVKRKRIEKHKHASRWPFAVVLIKALNEQCDGFLIETAPHLLYSKCHPLVLERSHPRWSYPWRWPHRNAFLISVKQTANNKKS